MRRHGLRPLLVDEAHRHPGARVVQCTGSRVSSDQFGDRGLLAGVLIQGQLS